MKTHDLGPLRAVGGSEADGGRGAGPAGVTSAASGGSRARGSPLGRLLFVDGVELCRGGQVGGATGLALESRRFADSGNWLGRLAAAAGLDFNIGITFTGCLYSR